MFTRPKSNFWDWPGTKLWLQKCRGELANRAADQMRGKYNCSRAASERGRERSVSISVSLYRRRTNKSAGAVWHRFCLFAVGIIVACIARAAGDFFRRCKKAKFIWPSSAVAAQWEQKAIRVQNQFPLWPSRKATDPSPSHFPSALAHSQFANLEASVWKRSRRVTQPL